MASNSICNHTRDETNRTPARQSSYFANHLYDYRPNNIRLHSVLLPLCTCIIIIVVPAVEFQSAGPYGVQHNVCSGSGLVCSDGSSSCVPHPQPCIASAPDFKQKHNMLWLHNYTVN